MSWSVSQVTTILALIFLTKLTRNAMLCKIIQKYEKWRMRNFSLVARYSLNFTRCSFLVVKSLVIHCKICSLLVAEVARWKKLLVTRCRSRSLQKMTCYSLQNSLVTRCKIRSLLVAEVSRCRKLLVTCCRSCLLQKKHSLLVAKFAHYSLQKLLSS